MEPTKLDIVWIFVRIFLYCLDNYRMSNGSFRFYSWSPRKLTLFLLIPFEWTFKTVLLGRLIAVTISSSSHRQGSVGGYYKEVGPPPQMDKKKKVNFPNSAGWTPNKQFCFFKSAPFRILSPHTKLRYHICSQVVK